MAKTLRSSSRRVVFINSRPQTVFTCFLVETNFHILNNTSLLRLSPDASEQPLFYVVKDRVMLNDREVFDLTQELLVWVHARTEHLLLLWTHLAHLLGHLVGG